MFCIISVLDDGLGMEEEKAEELRKQLRAHDNSSPSHRTQEPVAPSLPEIWRWKRTSDPEQGGRRF